MEIDFKALGMPVFTGRSRGEGLRKQLGLDSIPDGEVVRVKIPVDVYAITSSYFLGLFGPSIRKEGSPEAFFARFEFVGPPHIMEAVSDFVSRALREQKPLF